MRVQPRRDFPQPPEQAAPRVFASDVHCLIPIDGRGAPSSLGDLAPHAPETPNDDLPQAEEDGGEGRSWDHHAGPIARAEESVKERRGRKRRKRVGKIVLWPEENAERSRWIQK